MKSRRVGTRWRPNPKIAQYPERNDTNSMRSPGRRTNAIILYTIYRYIIIFSPENVINWHVFLTYGFVVSVDLTESHLN